MRKFIAFLLNQLLSRGRRAAIMADAKVLAKHLNARVDIPGLTEEQEEALFENAILALQESLSGSGSVPIEY